jgi:hypothetical protein
MKEENPNNTTEKARKLSMKKGIPQENRHYTRDMEAGQPSVLKKAIDTKDLSYISEFLVSRNRGPILAKLGGCDKEELGVLLLEFVDQPLRKEALDVIKEVVCSIRNVELFMDRLRKRAVDYARLVHLKGKLDYLKFLRSRKDGGCEEPETVVQE